MHVQIINVVKDSNSDIYASHQNCNVLIKTIHRHGCLALTHFWNNLNIHVSGETLLEPTKVAQVVKLIQDSTSICNS